MYLLIRHIFLWLLVLFAIFNVISNPIDDSVNNLSTYLNCTLMNIYLIWDLYMMFRNADLFRKNLLYHHVVCLFTFTVFGYSTPLTACWMLLAESVSLFNYPLQKSKYLWVYKFYNILIFRIPFWVLTIFYIWTRSKVSLDIYLLQQYYYYGPLIFILYDGFFITQVYKKMKQSKDI